MKVSLLLPVASAAFAAASFIVIPDEQTIKLVTSNNHHQAPITSDDKLKVVEPEKPHYEGRPHHEKDGHHCDVLHPEFILRERYVERSRLHGVPGFDADTIEGFSPAHILAGERTFEPSDFFRFYRSPGEPDHYSHGHRLHRGPHAEPQERPYRRPHGGPRGEPRASPGPLEGPRRGPLRSPRLPRLHKGPHGDPREGPHRRPDDGYWPPKPPGERLPWPPKPPGEPGEKPPTWPPKPPGDPDDIPRQPPNWPPEPEPRPCIPGKACKPGEPGDEPQPPPPPHWPPREPKEPGDKPPHWPGKPGDGPPHWPPREPKEPGKHPKHPPPPRHNPWKPHPPNETIWQLISKSNHTSKFASIVSEHEDLVAILNSTVANYTLFVPTNHAFRKFKNAPKDWKPPKDVVKKFLTYHISNGAYPVFKLLLGHTIASALDGGEIGGNQRIRVGLGPGGISVNFYSHVVAGNIFATNGVIHAVDSVLFPPPVAGRIIHFFPSEFSTFLLAVHLTNLSQEIPHEHTGGTLFAPPNSAFQKLGPKINGFLFSPWGRKYLKALLKYHIVLNETLYSDAYYHPTSDVKAKDIPKGHYHVDLPTLLEDKHLSIDISRFGGLITVIINAQSSVKVQDVIAKDGVIQVVGNVLIPPKKPPSGDRLTEQAVKEIDNAEDIENTMGMTVEQFRERFEGLVEDDGVTGEYKEEDILNIWEH